MLIRNSTDEMLGWLSSPLEVRGRALFGPGRTLEFVEGQTGGTLEAPYEFRVTPDGLPDPGAFEELADKTGRRGTFLVTPTGIYFLTADGVIGQRECLGARNCLEAAKRTFRATAPDHRTVGTVRRLSDQLDGLGFRLNYWPVAWGKTPSINLSNLLLPEIPKAPMPWPTELADPAILIAAAPLVIAVIIAIALLTSSP